MSGPSAPDPAVALAELVDREPLFHRIERGTGRADFEAMTAPDFWEVGASGARYDREHVWAVLEQRYARGGPDEWEAGDFACRPLGGQTVLVTYLLRQGDRLTRRATVWERSGADWRAVYHQGTETTG
ncbi:nuclear transport factor 2 family protein [Blastococcus sp. SYSU D00820]